MVFRILYQEKEPKKAATPFYELCGLPVPDNERAIVQACVGFEKLVKRLIKEGDESIIRLARSEGVLKVKKEPE